MLMFKRANRLTKNKEIEKVFKQGKSYYTDILGLKVIPNHTDQSRITVIVNTKVSKKAVERNRVKRQVRAIMIAELAHFKPGYDMIVICLPQIINQDFDNIKSNLQQAAKKLDLS